MKLRAQGCFEAYLVSGKIVRSDPTAVVLVVLRDFFGDIALVKRVSRGLKPRSATLVFVRSLFIGHVLQRGRKLGLHKAFADGGWPSVG